MNADYLFFFLGGGFFASATKFNPIKGEKKTKKLTLWGHFLKKKKKERKKERKETKRKGKKLFGGRQAPVREGTNSFFYKLLKIKKE